MSNTLHSVLEYIALRLVMRFFAYSLYLFAFLRCSRRCERPDGQAGWHNGAFFYRIPDPNGPEGRVYRYLAGAEELGVDHG